MPLIEPTNLTGNFLREKVVLIGGGGTGKSSSWLSIAWWAKESEDPRQFWVMDTDDEAVLQVMNEPKYAGMLAEDGGNVHVESVVSWPDYQAFSDKAVANAKKGDFIVLDFMNHVWPAAQDGYQQAAFQRSRDDAIYEAGVKKHASGWDLFKEANMDWMVVNSAYFSFTKPILLGSPAHIFMTSEEEEIKDAANMTPDAKEHLAQFGRWKPANAQKKLVYQCRTFLRIQRLARGRVLHTLKDRARPELKGADCTDFFQTYLRDTAGWRVE